MHCFFTGRLDVLALPRCQIERGPDFVTNADINRNEISTCGLYDYVFSNGGKNGEGICEW